MPDGQRMLTMVESLAAEAESIKGDIHILLQHSLLMPQQDYDPFALISPFGNNCWQELSVEARRLQAKALRRYSTYRDLVGTLIFGLSEETRCCFACADEQIRRNIEQQKNTEWATTEGVYQETMDAFACVADIIDGLYSSDGGPLVVPDTNALIANPEMSQWRFEWCESFELVFMPTVLVELDKLKIEHRNTDVRAKAKSIIRRMKEFRRRGDLLEGVSVVKDRITARAVAVGPRMANSLPWLDSDNGDDRFLSSVIELIRENTRRIVVVVTRDINLQNKAQLARLPFCEPPEAGGGGQPQAEDACQ